MTSPERLVDQWSALVTRVLAEAPADDVRAAGSALLDRYAEPHRRYHSTAHLAEVLDRIDELRGSAAFPDLVRLAAWFHDAIYDPTRAAVDPSIIPGGAAPARRPGTEPSLPNPNFWTPG